VQQEAGEKRHMRVRVLCVLAHTESCCGEDLGHVVVVGDGVCGGGVAADLGLRVEGERGNEGSCGRDLLHEAALADEVTELRGAECAEFRDADHEFSDLCGDSAGVGHRCARDSCEI